MALMAWFVAAAPSARVDLVLFQVPRWVVGIVFVFSDLRGVVGGGLGIAHLAHLVGAFQGVLFGYYGLRWDRLWRGSGGRRSRRDPPAPGPRPRAEPPDSEPRTSPPGPDPVSRRIDEILAKISVVGMEGLEEEERAFLRENSGRYRS